MPWTQICSLPCTGKNTRLDARLGSGKGGHAWQAAETLFYAALETDPDYEHWYLSEQYGFALWHKTKWKKGGYGVLLGPDGATPTIGKVHFALAEAAESNEVRYKPDIVLLSPDGRQGELLEIGTSYREKRAQVMQKVQAFNWLMKTRSLPTRWSASPWRPKWLSGCRSSLPFEGMYVCAEPTWRDGSARSQGSNVGDGVLLYEIHKVPEKQPKELAIAVSLPAIKGVREELERIGQKLRPHLQPVHSVNQGRQMSRRILTSFPGLQQALRAAVIIAGTAVVALAVAGLLLEAFPLLMSALVMAKVAHQLVGEVAPFRS